jgi:hypothetical protein
MFFLRMSAQTGFDTPSMPAAVKGVRDLVRDIAKKLGTQFVKKNGVFNLKLG